MPKITKKRGKIELLAPAGDLTRLKTAVIFGADAVYCGLPQWSMRSGREITFTLKTLQEGIDFAHKNGVKVYLTFNIFPHEKQLKYLKRDLLKIENCKLKIDGIILADLGVLALVKKYLPKVPIHLSTQANTVNSESAKMWKKMGVKRIVLARELTLSEIKSISQQLKIKNSKIKNLSLEVFGHGAMCIAYSGRCLLSKYFVGREANLGECSQSCRWRYKIEVKSEKLKVKSDGVPSGQFFLEEETRPGELHEIIEDDNGSYIMSSKDLMTLDILPQFIAAGIDALKIEGRAKSPYYLATVVRAYRHAIDDGYSPALRAELDKLVNRGYSHGFLLGSDSYEQNYDIAAYKPKIIFLGQVCLDVGRHDKLSGRPTSRQETAVSVEVKNKFAVGETVEIITPGEIYKVKIKEIEDGSGAMVDEVRTPREIVKVKFNKKMPDLVPYAVIRKKAK